MKEGGGFLREKGSDPCRGPPRGRKIPTIDYLRPTRSEPQSVESDEGAERKLKKKNASLTPKHTNRKSNHEETSGKGRS